MKKLPKIAIVYDAENWKTTTKLAVDLLREQGFNVKKRKDSFGNATGCKYIKNWDENNEFQYVCTEQGDDVIVLTMPQDLPRLKEILGVDVPKDGEVYVITAPKQDHLWVTRLREDRSSLYSAFNCDDPFFTRGGKWDDDREFRKATPEEEAKLIEAEHSRGYHWDGKELVKIPEYVEIIGENINSRWSNNKQGEIFKVDHTDEDWVFVDESRCIEFMYVKPSTKAAYEAQKKLQHVNSISFEVNISDESKGILRKLGRYTQRLVLVKENNELKERIKELEEENEKLENSRMGLKHQNKRLRDFVNTIKEFELK